jgi:acyl carrier protein
MPQNLETILAKTFRLPVEKITDNLSMKNLEIWDSLMHMDLIISLEEFYGFELSMDEIMNMVDVATIRKIVLDRTG